MHRQCHILVSFLSILDNLHNFSRHYSGDIQVGFLPRPHCAIKCRNLSSRKSEYFLSRKKMTIDFLHFLFFSCSGVRVSASWTSLLASVLLFNNDPERKSTRQTLPLLFRCCVSGPRRRNLATRLASFLATQQTSTRL